MLCHPEKMKDNDPDSVRLANRVGEDRDIIIICGFRPEDQQNWAYENGVSHARWPDSDHNKIPCRVLDMAPYDVARKKIHWSDINGFLELRNWWEICARELGIAAQGIIKFKNKRGLWVVDYDHFALN